jgi:SAM-dependent methyltransferase
MLESINNSRAGGCALSSRRKIDKNRAFNAHLFFEGKTVVVGNIKPDPLPPAPPQRLETLTACPLCGGNMLLAAPVQPQPPFGITQCAACGGIFLSPRPFADAMRKYYDEFYAADENAVSKRQERRAQRHFGRLMRYSGKPGRILEIGAGDGYLLNEAKKGGWQVEGLELSQPRVQRAKEWFGIDLQCADLQQAQLIPGSFDAVVMFQLIEHVHDPRGLLTRVNSLLRPGGVMMLSTPNVLAYSRKRRDVDSWRIPRHLFFFTPRTLVRTVERCGFDVLRRGMKLCATLEERLGWQPWPDAPLLAGVTRDLWTPFGLHLAARKQKP